jgi:hypothetical protein
VIEDGDRPFWATVNICDTATSPNAVGIRTSVPGNGSGERIWARYTAQWWSGAAQEWKTVGGSGVTDWVYVGVADRSARRAGRSRRARGAQRVAVVRQRTLLTETGMQGVQGGDPAGTSKAMCLIW